MPVSIYALPSLVRCASDTYCPPLHFIWHCVISVLPSVVLYVYSNGHGVHVCVSGVIYVVPVHVCALALLKNCKIIAKNIKNNRMLFPIIFMQ